MTLKRGLALGLAGAAGVLAALVQAGAGELPWPEAPLAPVGEALRALSLSGFGGNLLAWAVALVLALLPMLLWFFPWGRGARGWEDGLLPLTSGVLFFLIYYTVNPTLLEGWNGFWPLVALGVALSLLLSWGLLRLLRALEAVGSGEAPARLLELLLLACALSVVCSAVYSAAGVILPLLFGEGGESGPGLVILATLAILGLLPRLMGAWVLLGAADLCPLLARDPFGEEAAERCGQTARWCRLPIQLSILTTAAGNLLQLLCFPLLNDVGLRLDVPLLTLACSAALYLLCRCLRRGKDLQDENQSII